MPIYVNEIVTDAMEEIVVQADEAPIEPSEGRAAIRLLNDMMFSFAARGLNLGYTVVYSLGDIVTVPLGAIRWIKLQLAIELAPKYNVEISNTLASKARSAYKAVQNLAIDGIYSEYPSTLPYGSGNYEAGGWDSTFYPDKQDTILTETGGSIALEDDTEEA